MFFIKRKSSAFQAYSAALRKRRVAESLMRVPLAQ